MVKEVCILSPLLFNLYSEEIFDGTFTETTEGIIIYGTVVDNIRHPDDLMTFMNPINSTCKHEHKT